MIDQGSARLGARGWRRAPWGLALAAAVIAVFLGGPTARADTSPDDAVAAEKAMERANEELQRREYESAIKHFQEAHNLLPNASGPYLGLGLAFAATDRCPEALEALDRYLQHRSKEPKPEAKVAMDSCKARLAQAGVMRVESEPPGAEVRIDAEDALVVGTTPFETAALANGAHKVYLHRSGYKPYSADVTIGAGTRVLVGATLESTTPVVINSSAPATPTTQPGEPGTATPLVAVVPSEHPAEPTTPSVAPTKSAAPAPAGTGQISVTSTVLPALVLINGERLSSDGHAEVTLPPGLYSVAVQRDGYRGASGSIPLVAGERKSFQAPLRRLKSQGGTGTGVLFTLLAAGSESAAIAGHVLANHSVYDTSDFNTYSKLEFYGQIGAGCAAAVALVGFIVDAVINRGRADEGPPFPLEPATGSSPPPVAAPVGVGK